MGIEQEIENWDGKSSSDISAIYSRYGKKASFVPKLIELSRQEGLQKGATWLLKHHLENKHRLNANDVATIYKLTPKFKNWEAKLHILQSIPYMPVGEAEKKGVELFLRNSLTDTNKFVRAWAYNGFYEISLQYHEYKEETKQFFEMAMRDEAPSVKARIRSIMKNDF
tara:strand:+ start:2399 stop:2902 length:504 start_codon:yes stop_codon:yes gene_type:complete